MVLLQAANLLEKEVTSRKVDSEPSVLRARIMQQQKHFFQFLNFIHTLQLFTHTDILTFALPTTLFAVFGAAADTTLSTNDSLSLLTVLGRIPFIILLVWSNLLVFNIANQRHPDAVLEDKLNKPIRPLPSGRISPVGARRLLLVALPVVLALSFYLGPWQETLLLFSLNWMYNDLKGCDEDFVTRNLLIAIGHGLYNSAALRIACGGESSITNLGMCWIVLESCIIFTTGPIADLKDQAGDKTRDRRSIPLVLGDETARYAIAIPVMLWSLVCPLFFGLGYQGYLVPVAIGCLVAVRTLLLRRTENDIVTWKLWAVWCVVLFSLPLVKEHAALTVSLKSLLDGLYTEPDYSSSLNLLGISSVAMLIQSRKLRGYVSEMGISANGTLI